RQRVRAPGVSGAFGKWRVPRGRCAGSSGNRCRHSVRRGCRRGVSEAGWAVTRLLGLYREPQYSPGRHRSNDTLLLEQVAGLLRARGAVVDLARIGDATSVKPSISLVFSMWQGRAALDL